MATPTTGPISFQNLKDEFGDTSPTGLGEFYRGSTYVPYNALSSASGRISIGELRGIGRYWELTTDPNNQIYNSITDIITDGTYVIIRGRLSGYRGGQGLACVRVSDGTIVWQKSQSGTDEWFDYGFSLIGSSQQVNTGGPFTMGEPGFFYYCNGYAIIKLRVSDCAVIWQRSVAVDVTNIWANSYTAPVKWASILYHLDGHIYISASAPSTSGGIVFLKYNTNGTKIWDKAYYNDFSTFPDNGIWGIPNLLSYNSTTILLITNTSWMNSGQTDGTGVTARLSTSGNISSIRTLGSPGTANIQFLTAVRGGNGFFYATYESLFKDPSFGGGVDYSRSFVYLVKFSSDSRIEWARRLPNGSSISYVSRNNGLCVDSSGNIYLGWAYYPANGFEGGEVPDVYLQYNQPRYRNGECLVIQKFNSSGSLLLTRRMYRRPAAKDFVSFSGSALLSAGDKIITHIFTQSYSQTPSLIRSLSIKDADFPIPESRVNIADNFIRYEPFSGSEVSVSNYSIANPISNGVPALLSGLPVDQGVTSTGSIVYGSKSIHFDRTAERNRIPAFSNDNWLPTNSKKISAY